MTISGVSLADIARKAGVGGAAVSNWRTRYADFPQPNGGTRRSPTFNSDTVDRWLADHPSLGVQAVPPQPKSPAGPPPPLAEPLLNLLRRAHTRQPGVWLLHEEILDRKIATAHLIRRLAADGHIERALVTTQSGTRVLVRVPHVDDTVDTHDIEYRVNAVLAAVGHHVTIHPARAGAGRYTSTTVTHRSIRYTGYLCARPWTVTIEQTPRTVDATGTHEGASPA